MEMSTTYDFAPLYRSVIGFDRMADLIETAMRGPGDAGYPPYNIERTGEDSYCIALATAGYRADELELTAQPNLLIVAGRKREGDDGRTYVYRGVVTAPSFERRFELADYVVVKSASYADGVLSVDLMREIPEALKPRRIDIGAPASVARRPAAARPQPSSQNGSIGNELG
jgi:molecular chaperone IbpA